MLKNLLRAGALTAAIFCLPAVAGTECADLSVTTTPDPGGTTQDVTLAVTGSFDNALTFMAVGQTEGTTTFDFPLGSLTLGLELPFAIIPIGVTDAAGDLSLSFTTPAGTGITLFLQSASIDFTIGGGGPPSLDFCESNVATLDL